MQALLDLISAVDGSVSEAAKYVGLSTGALSRLILSHDSLRMAVNQLRASKVTIFNFTLNLLSVVLVSTTVAVVVVTSYVLAKTAH